MNHFFLFMVSSLPYHELNNYLVVAGIHFSITIWISESFGHGWDSFLHQCLNHLVISETCLFLCIWISESFSFIHGWDLLLSVSESVDIFFQVSFLYYFIQWIIWSWLRLMSLLVFESVNHLFIFGICFTLWI